MHFTRRQFLQTATALAVLPNAARASSSDLVAHEAMQQIAETGKGPENQIPSMGCSIKWKAA